MLGEQAPSTGEAAGAPRLRLERAHRAGLAGPEAVGREGAGKAVAWKAEVTAQAGVGVPGGGGLGWAKPGPWPDAGRSSHPV